MSLLASIHVSHVRGQLTCHIAIPGHFEATVPIGPEAAQRITEELRTIAMRCCMPEHESKLPEIEQK